MTRTGAAGAALLAAALLGYACYELALLPAAGLPVDDMTVILAGADTLRVGHLLKFGYALGMALLAVGLCERLRAVTPTQARLAAGAAVTAVALFLASGTVGLRILDVAEEFAAAGNAVDARSTILIRVVTVALLQAATLAVGAFALLVGLAGLRSGALPRWLAALACLLGALFLADLVLPDPLGLVAPLLTIVWAAFLAAHLWSPPEPARCPAGQGDQR